MSKKLVTSVGPLQKLKLTKSLYDTESDTKKISEYVSKMFGYNYYGEGQQVKKVDVTLANPTLVYMRKYSVVGTKSQEYSEYLVPALKFEVVNKPAEYYNSDSIIVPIAKDFFEDNTDMGYPMPMPLMEPASPPADPTTSTPPSTPTEPYPIHSEDVT